MNTNTIITTAPAHHTRGKLMSACINWRGAVSSTGYGVRRFQCRLMGAHRAAFIETKGPIPAGAGVLHSCDNRLCVNPDHLFSGTQRDNVKDMLEKGREKPWGRTVTHCPQGHEYSADNTRTHEGGRYCKACQRVRSLKRYYQARATLAAINAEDSQ